MRLTRRRRQRRNRQRNLVVGTETVLTVTILLLTLEYLFRISLILGWTTPLRGYTTQSDFWAASEVGVLPLFVAFALVFLLLLAWQVILFWTEGRRLSTAAKVIGAANAALIVALGLSMWGSLDPMWAERYYASGAGDWNARELWPTDYEEFLDDRAKPFLGRWKVESFERLGTVGPSSFPYSWVEIPKRGRWIGWEAASSTPEFHYWEPPSVAYPGAWVLDRAGGSPMTYMLQPKLAGDQLVLLSDEAYPGPRFRVVLVRVGDLTPPSTLWAALESWPANSPR